MRDILGEVVYLRTYSRYIEDKKRREYWHETIERVVDWSVEIAPTFEGEREQLFDLWGNKRALPAGRSLWIGGTDYSRKFALGNFNCSFTTVRSPVDFRDIVFLLMSGAGVGFSARRKDVSALNETIPLESIANVNVRPYNYVGRPGVLEDTIVEDIAGGVRIIVGDSRMGWAQAVQYFFEALPRAERIEINVNYIRPLGSRLRTFGGFASGPEPLIEFFELVPKILKRAPERSWSSTKILDITNLIGRMVVAGGSRRSAQIALGDADDSEFIEAKTGEWYKENPWRSQSNNSVVFMERPTRDKIIDLLHYTYEFGEPGFINGEQASRRKREWAGINPCAEILLSSNERGSGGGLCNLTTINLPAFIEGNSVNLDALLAAIRLQARHSVRITMLNIELEGWKAIQQRDRLLGLSLTGIGDFLDTTGMTNEQFTRMLSVLRHHARREADLYAAELGINRPELITTIKPEGTGSQVLGVSSGVHPPFAPYYIRRVRINEHDSVAQALIFQGFPYERDYFNDNVLVFSFPIKTNAKRNTYSYSAIELLERYKLTMKYYVDHNTSITVYFDESEIEPIADWLLENWDSYVAVSFLRKSNEVYPQQPYEEIDEDTYKRLRAQMPSWDRRVLDEIERTGFNAGDLEEECATGACPVR